MESHNRKLYIRVDMNPEIASGHVMRCISIAKVFHEAKWKVQFISSDNYPVNLYEEYGFDYKILDTDWSDLSTELHYMKKMFDGTGEELLLIDTYKVTKEYIDCVSKYIKVCYIGSKYEYLGQLYAWINYSSDINYAFYEKFYRNKETKLLLGVQYAPLREEFQNSNNMRKRNGVSSILVTTGNTELNGVINNLLEALKMLKIFKTLEVSVIVGSMFQHKEKLKERFSEYANIKFYEHVRNMASIIENTDLAITAGGTTVYELAAMGVPIIAFAMVEEQEKGLQGMGALGAVCFCGSMKNQQLCVKKILCALDYYIQNPNEAYALGMSAHGLIDGKGAQRIYCELSDM